MTGFFFRLDGGDSLDFQSVIYFIFNIGPGVGVGVGVDQEPGVGAGVGVGTAPPRLRTPAYNNKKKIKKIGVLPLAPNVGKCDMVQ